MNRYIAAAILTWSLSGCVGPTRLARNENIVLPPDFGHVTGPANMAAVDWRRYFADPNLISLIDTALKRNQELNIALQEIEISRNEVRARKGEYLPFVGIGAEAAIEKEGRFTRTGAIDENVEIEPGKAFPDPFTDYFAGAHASWELDIWRKLRNAKKAAVSRYLATAQGRNFMVTHLIAEIARTYNELMALDNQLEIIDRNIAIQNSGLQVVRQQKEAAKATQLAVSRFEAQLLNTTNLQFEVRQRIVEAENRIHSLSGVFPRTLPRSSAGFYDITSDSVFAGFPAQLLENRPDVRQAELSLVAAKLDVKVARANFYPSLRLQARAGLHAFSASRLINPESMLVTIAGDVFAPLINRNAIKAMYRNANARQLQEVYNYERTVLNAYLEVMTQLSLIENLTKSYETKTHEVDILVQAIGISNSLFTSARADYLEVLLTQREALESKMELVELKMNQLNAKVGIYRALGGGWN